MRRRISQFGFFVVALLVTAACADQPSAPSDVKTPERSENRFRTPAVRVGMEAFRCVLSRATPNAGHRYQYGWTTVYFPRPELAPGGATILYRYRGVDERHQVAFAADCRIPATAAAVERVNRTFGPAQAERSAGSDGGAVIQSDLPGLIVTVCQWGGYYPNCRAKSGTQLECSATGEFCSGGDPGGGDGGGEAGDGGWNGAGDDEDPPCDPQVDPQCHQPLTTKDSTSIKLALKDYVRPDTAIKDTTARRECAQMRQQFETSFAAGDVFRGQTGSTTDSLAHYGATYNGQIHFDPWLLDGANGGSVDLLRELANTALHEAAHVLGFTHPNAPTIVNGHDVYTDRPFNLLSPGPNSCIKY